MNTNNLQRFEFPELGIDIEAEIQSVPLRIFEHKGKEIIGVCMVEAAGVGQSTIKLLFIDSPWRHLTKSIHGAIQSTICMFGFKERLHQRKKNGVFITIFKSLAGGLSRLKAKHKNKAGE